MSNFQLLDLIDEYAMCAATGRHLQRNHIRAILEDFLKTGKPDAVSIEVKVE